MPRESARIKAAIWSDRDFTALPLDAQWLYMALLSQPGLNLAGVLTIPRRMWANLASDEDTPDRIAHAWKVLEDHRYVVSDDETDELLIRSFIRNDIEVGAPGPFVAAMVAAAAVQSPRLRAVLAAELQRLDTERLAEKKPARHGERPYEVWQRTVAALGGDAMSGQPKHGMNTPTTHAMPHAMKNAEVHAMPHVIGAGAGVGVGEGGSVGNGVTSVGAADAAAAPAKGEPKKPKRSRGARLPDDWLPTRELVAWGRERVPGVDTRHETEKFRNHWHAASGTNAVKRDWNAAWRNWMLKASEWAPAARGSKQPAPSQGRLDELPPEPEQAFAQLHERGDVDVACELLGRSYVEEPQRPSDQTPRAEYRHRDRQRWLDENRDQLLAALHQRSAA